jgi:hypothetical protein
MGFFNTADDLEKAVSAIARETRAGKIAAA